MQRLLLLLSACACSALMAASTRAPAKRTAAPDLSLTPAAIVRAAGEAHTEVERHRLLASLLQRPDLEPRLRSEIERLLPLADDWANGKTRAAVDDSRAAENGYLCRFITGRIQPAALPAPAPSRSPAPALHPPEPARDSPLHPLWAFYRARLLVWRVIQSGPLLRVKESRDAYYGEARRLFQEARDAFPANHIIRMYLGEPLPWKVGFAPDPDAPDWANLQREGLERLADIVHWWIRERQLPDGQFGGGWGDDVEMWRWWIPVLIAFEDPLIVDAQARTSAGIFERPHLRGGFTSRLTDVEHSNEDTTDTILPMMHLRPDDPLWQGRALRLAELMRTAWTGRNERGLLQFKSIYFSIDRVDEAPRRAFDTVYHPSIVQPTLLYWQRTGDPSLTRLFGEWLHTWVDASAREEHGKPAGILPSTLAWPSGSVGHAGAPWWEPFPLNHNDALYNWPGASGLMSSSLLLAWHMTRDDRYLAPIRSMAKFALAHQKDPDGGRDPAPGSDAWIARQLERFLPDTLAKYRLLSGDASFDAYLAARARGYAKFRLLNDRRALLSGLTRNAEAFRSNWEAFTAEMRWTDRVLNFTSNYLRYLPEEAPPTPSPEVLYASATGDPGSPLVFPLNAVRWRTPPRAIAALVTQSGPSSFGAELFHFGDTPRTLSAEFLLLRPGDYELLVTPLGTSHEAPATRTVFRVEGPRAEVSLTLPARRLTTVTVMPSRSTGK